MDKPKISTRPSRLHPVSKKNPPLNPTLNGRFFAHATTSEKGSRIHETEVAARIIVYKLKTNIKNNAGCCSVMTPALRLLLL